MDPRHARTAAFTRGRPVTWRDWSKESAVPSVQNGMRASALGVTWLKSRHSNAEGNCVEVAALPGGGIAVAFR